MEATPAKTHTAPTVLTPTTRVCARGAGPVSTVMWTLTSVWVTPASAHTSATTTRTSLSVPVPSTTLTASLSSTWSPSSSWPGFYWSSWLVPGYTDTNGRRGQSKHGTMLNKHQLERVLKIDYVYYFKSFLGFYVGLLMIYRYFIMVTLNFCLLYRHKIL